MKRISCCVRILPCLLMVPTGCGTDLEPPRAATVTVTPRTATLDFLGQSATFSAAVSDQYGHAFAGTVIWTSEAPAVFTVNSTGEATAVANGTGAIRAEVAGIHGTARVIVRQTPTTVERVAGDAQRGRPGSALHQPLVARVLDAGGSPVAGPVVFFSPTDGGGFATPGAATTDIVGEARTSWTLGVDFGHQSLIASVAVGPSTVFTAAALRPNELADSVDVVSGDGQVARPGKGLRRPIVLRVLDDHGLPLEGATMLFDAPPGHGFADPDSIRSNSRGEGATTWTLGEKVGLQLLTVSVPGGPSARVMAMGSEGVCERTAEVRDALLRATGMGRCEEVTDSVLSEIESLNLSRLGITRVAAHDFAGLSDLADLNLGNNQLTTLPIGVFSDSPNLRYLSLHSNHLTELETGVFSGLLHLKELSLTNNRLGELPVGVFSELNSLVELQLNLNRLELHAGVLAGLANLETLVLRDNEITELPKGVFVRLSALSRLDMSGNRLTVLSDEGFAGLSGLEHLDLGGNQVTTLPTGVFRELSGLISLGLAGNRLTELSTGDFAGLHELRELNINDNQLTAFPKGVFSELPGLISLHLAFNRLTGLSAEDFGGLSSLEDLGLAGNRLDSLPPGVFGNLQHLRGLGLTDNRLSELPTGVFEGLAKLETLGLDGNNLSDVSADTWRGLANLKFLGLTGNQIREVPPVAFSGLDSLEALLISYNRLSALPDSVLSGLGELGWLWLQENPGSPFPFVLQMERIDTTDLGAPGPATLVVKVDEGAPFDMQMALSAQGATLSPSIIAIPAGATRSTPLTVTAHVGNTGAVIVSLGVAPEVPQDSCPYTGQCYKGIVISNGNPIKLFE